MFAKIRHVATNTERYDTMAKFYQTIFGMKQMRRVKTIPIGGISATGSLVWHS